MLDHVGITVADFARSRRFYRQALAPLGIDVVMDIDPALTGGTSHAGFGAHGKPFFWIGDAATAAAGVHVAFIAASRAAVDAFHHAALAAGGSDNGAPGLRPHYHPHYYGAFIRDPDGHNIEAVCHHPE